MNSTLTPNDRQPVPMNGQPITMFEVVEHETAGYRAWSNAMGDFLASQMDRLAQLIRWTSASNPAEFDDRMEIYERELRDRLFDRGYHQGLEAGRRERGVGTCNPDRD